MSTVAKALIYDDSGYIMVLRRSVTHPRFPYHLDFPGGDVEDGESALEGVLREVLEETGLEIPHHQWELVHELEHKPGAFHLIFQTQLSEVQPSITHSWEHDDYAWIPPHQLLAAPVPDDVDSYYLHAIEYLRQQTNAA